MSYNLIEKKVVLFGVGKMGIEYAKILTNMGVDFQVFGRSNDGVDRFYSQTGIKATTNGFKSFQAEGRKDTEFAIVAVNVEELAVTVIELIKFGIRKILLEKPAGLNIKEIKKVRDKAKETGTQIIVAYNRRFYASVLKAQEIIKSDGGVKSFNFDFTEMIYKLPPSLKESVKKNWFLANSTHVIDLAFFLGGEVHEIKTYTSGKCDWNSGFAIFSGAGVTTSGALFSYNANWNGPGRWGIEFITDYHRLIFRPLETLQIQVHKSVLVDVVEIDDQIDKDFKPGLFKQTQFFIEGIEHPNFINIDKHYDNVKKYYQKINS